MRVSAVHATLSRKRQGTIGALAPQTAWSRDRIGTLLQSNRDAIRLAREPGYRLARGSTWRELPSRTISPGTVEKSRERKEGVAP